MLFERQLADARDHFRMTMMHDGPLGDSSPMPMLTETTPAEPGENDHVEDLDSFASSIDGDDDVGPAFLDLFVPQRVQDGTLQIPLHGRRAELEGAPPQLHFFDIGVPQYDLLPRRQL